MKLLAIAILFLSPPTASHAIANAAFVTLGYKKKKGEENRVIYYNMLLYSFGYHRNDGFNFKPSICGNYVIRAFSLGVCDAFVVMDAVDVAFTEAAVGAGVSCFDARDNGAYCSNSERDKRNLFFPLIVVCLVGVLLIYGTLDMPNFGAFDSPAQLHLGSKYLSITYKDMGIPNVVTGILASYRGI